MAFQQASLPLFAELQIVTSFVVVVVCIEIVAVFLARMRSNPGSRAAWIRVFVISAITLAATHGFELYAIIGTMDEILAGELVDKVNLLFVDVECVFLFHSLSTFDRFKHGSPRVSTYLAIGSCLIVFSMHLTEILSMGTVSILPRVMSFILLLPSIGIPATVAIFLLYRSDTTIRMHYRLFVIGFLLAGIGDLVYLYCIMERDSFSGNSYGLVLSYSAFSIIVGSAMFFIALYLLPYFEDFYWRQDLLALNVFNTKTNEVVFKRTFPGIDKVPTSASGSALTPEQALMVGISGIDDFITSIVEMPQGKLEFIDKDGKKIMLAWRRNLVFVLVARSYVPVMKVKLMEFSRKYLQAFDTRAINPIQQPESLDHIQQLVLSIFTPGRLENQKKVEEK